MARKALVEVLGDATSFARSLRQSAEAADKFSGKLHTLSVDAKASAEAQVKASLRKDARLREEIAAYKKVASEAKRGSQEQIAAANLAATSQAKLARSMGVTRRESKALHADAEKLGRDFSQIARGAVAGSGALKGLGSRLAFLSAGYLSAAGVVSAIKSSIRDASDLNEQLNKTDVVFRGSQEQVRRWSDGLNKAFGLTRAEALATAGTFGNMLVPMGFARSDAAKMSERLVQLAGDMASFNNASPQDTLAALQSGLAGQVRPLRQFGVFLTQDRIAAEALADGIAKANVNIGKVRDASEKVAVAQAKVTKATADYGEGSVQAVQATTQFHSAQRLLSAALAGSAVHLTNAQKAAAIYAIILKDTKDAQGDAARTSGAFAGQLRREHAIVGDLKERIGGQLLPTVNKYLTAANDWLGKSRNQERVTKDVHTAVAALKGIIGAATPIVTGLAHGIQGFSDAVGGAKNAAKLFGAALAAWKLSKWTGELGLFGKAAGKHGAAGEVSLLRSRLLALRALGTIGVTIVVGYEVAKGAQQFSKWLGGTAFGKAIGAGDRGTIQDMRRWQALQDGAKRETPGTYDVPRPSIFNPQVTQQPATVYPGGAPSATAAVPAGFAGPKPLTAAQQLTLGLAGSPNKLSLLQAQAANQAAAMNALKQARAAGRIGNKAYVEQMALLLADHRQTEEQIASIETAAANKEKSARAKAAAARTRAQMEAFHNLLTNAQEQIKQYAKLTKARDAKLQANQFKALGLGASGQGVSPLHEPLGKELARLKHALTGTILDTDKNTHLLTQVGRVLDGQFGALTSKTRAAVRKLLDTLDGELKKHKGFGPTGRVVTAESLTAGWGLSAPARRRAEQQIAQAIAHHGMIPAAPSANGAPVIVHTQIDLDGKHLAHAVTTHQEKNGRYQSPQRRGPNAGRGRFMP